MKKMLTLFAALLLVLSMLPMTGLAEEPEVFTLFASTEAIEGPWKDMYTFKKIEEMFGVQLDITEISNTVWQEKVSVAFATDEYPDFFLNGLTDNDIQTYGSQGILLDLKDYITEENTPNLYALYQSYPIMQKACMSYDGHQYVIKGYDRTNTREYLKARFFVNTQWIRNLGLEEPTTLDELYEVLKAFKEGDPNGNGDTTDEIPMLGAYSNDPYSLLTVPLTAYGYTLAYGNNNTYVDVDKDGKVFFVPTAEHFPDALAWMKKLYDEELLDPEYFTQTADQVNAKQSEMRGGCFMDWAQWLDIADPEKYNEYDGIEPLTTDVNTEKLWPATDFQGVGLFCVTDKCQNVEKLLKIADWAVSFDGYCTLLGGEEVGKMPGLEDQGYTIEHFDESYGENALTLNYTRPDSYESDTAWREAVISAGWGTLPVCRIDFTFVDSSVTEQALSSALNDNYTPYMKVGWPDSVKFTDEEWNSISLLVADIQSYLDQMVAKFITGEESLDNFDAFVQGLNDRGLAQYLEIYQTAYDRYLAG